MLIFEAFGVGGEGEVALGNAEVFGAVGVDLLGVDVADEVGLDIPLGFVEGDADEFI